MDFCETFVETIRDSKWTLFFLWHHFTNIKVDGRKLVFFSQKQPGSFMEKHSLDHNDHLKWFDTVPKGYDRFLRICLKKTKKGTFLYFFQKFHKNYSMTQNRLPFFFVVSFHQYQGVARRWVRIPTPS